MNLEQRHQLETVNSIVNAMPYITDQKQFGQEEYWEETGKGDCEDKVLAKMAMLRHLGWARGDLNMAICKVGGIGHAVLAVASDDGTMILDNAQPKVCMWRDLPYKWLEMSVGGSLKQWVAITD